LLAHFSCPVTHVVPTGFGVAQTPLTQVLGNMQFVELQVGVTQVFPHVFSVNAPVEDTAHCPLLLHA
jgi:hypothetical protein